MKTVHYLQKSCFAFLFEDAFEEFICNRLMDEFSFGSVWHEDFDVFSIQWCLFQLEQRVPSQTA
jgi:hypothetical protein